MTPHVVMPPAGTSIGCRSMDGSMWNACHPEKEDKPGIAVCEFAGNYVNPPYWRLVAVFERAEDRDFVLALHLAYLNQNNKGDKDS